jgi:uncharacterized protein (DUF1697 family)
MVLLRGINIGSRNRIAMPRLREALSDAGFADVGTYVQSGNVVLTSDARPAPLAAECKRLIAVAFGLEIDVVVRTRDELAEVVHRNPLADVAVNPKRYQVSFLTDVPPPDIVQKLAALAVEPERLVAIGTRAIRLASRQRGPLSAMGSPGRAQPRRHRDRPQLDDCDEPRRARRLLTEQTATAS